MIRIGLSPAVPYGKKKYRTSSTDTLRISFRRFDGRKKYNHEVIEHILSVSVGKRGDLEITTKSSLMMVPFICSCRNNK
jgi:hypothetical protein